MVLGAESRLTPQVRSRSSSLWEGVVFHEPPLQVTKSYGNNSLEQWEPLIRAPPIQGRPSGSQGRECRAEARAGNAAKPRPSGNHL